MNGLFGDWGANVTEEEKKEWEAKHEEWFNSLSNEEKKQVEAAYERMKAWYDSLTEEEQQEVKKIHQQRREWWNSLSEEQKQEIKQMDQHRREWWNSLNDEQKQQLKQAHEKRKEHWNSLSEDEKKAWMLYSDKNHQHHHHPPAQGCGASLNGSLPSPTPINWPEDVPRPPMRNNSFPNPWMSTEGKDVHHHHHHHHHPACSMPPVDGSAPPVWSAGPLMDAMGKPLNGIPDEGEFKPNVHEGASNMNGQDGQRKRGLRTKH